MVLAEVGASISGALEKMRNATIIDEKVVTDCLIEITRGLLQSDVQFKLVHHMQTKIKSIVDMFAESHIKDQIIQEAVFTQLYMMLDPGKPSFTLRKDKGKRSVVVMFVGLQGSGKTTTCTKYARYHHIKGWKPALVCADTSSFDQLKLHASEANIPFYGSSDVGSDPVKVAVEGVETFKKGNCCDLIIVDTSGAQGGEVALFEETRKVYEATKPDFVMFVMDSSIGQAAAFDQAQAFKQSSVSAVGAVILTKMDGQAKAGGTLSALAATGSPVIFIGTGEHMDDFELFDAKRLARRLSGMDIPKPFERVGRKPSTTLTLRIMYEQFQNILTGKTTGPVANVPPGFCSELMPQGAGKKSKAKKIRRYMTMMKTMADEELDSREPEKLIMNDETRMMRIARGAGCCQLREVVDMFEEYKRLARAWRKLTDYEIFIKGDMMSGQHRKTVSTPPFARPRLGMVDHYF